MTFIITDPHPESKRPRSGVETDKFYRRLSTADVHISERVPQFDREESVLSRPQTKDTNRRSVVHRSRSLRVSRSNSDNKGQGAV